MPLSSLWQSSTALSCLDDVLEKWCYKIVQVWYFNLTNNEYVLYYTYKILFIILLLKGFMVFKVYGSFHEEKEICYIHETF